MPGNWKLVVICRLQAQHSNDCVTKPSPTCSLKYRNRLCHWQIIHKTDMSVVCMHWLRSPYLDLLEQSLATTAAHSRCLTFQKTPQDWTVSAVVRSHSDIVRVLCIFSIFPIYILYSLYFLISFYCNSSNRLLIPFVHHFTVKRLCTHLAGVAYFPWSTVDMWLLRE